MRKINSNKSKWTAFAIILALSAYAIADNVVSDDLNNPPQLEEGVLTQDNYERITSLVIALIEYKHYKGRVLDDKLSKEIFNEYIKSLDPNKLYFTASDISEFELEVEQFDDYLKEADLATVRKIHERFQSRLAERISKAKKIVQNVPDFTIDEVFITDRDSAQWQNGNEYEDEWRKKVKFDFLNLKLNNKSDEEIKESLVQRYDNILRRSGQLKDIDIFELFLNAYANVIEPHTNYFSPRTSENFKIRMSLSLEGIGAVLSSDNEYTKVRSVMKGGPAYLSSQVKSGDLIVGVGQGENHDNKMENVVGWRLDDVVDKIRGPRGSSVRLEIQPKSSAEGKTKIVTIVRDKIDLEEQAAQSSIINIDNGADSKTLGVIELPTFYSDFEAQRRGDKNYRSTTRDIRKLIKNLQDINIDGLIIDLRNNGGGSLEEANALTGLFIESGPVVQVLDSSGYLHVEQDPDDELVYDGPLTVLINRNSASASEIFAGAIQDYNRGVIIGEPSYGKGTVQELIDLDNDNNFYDSLLDNAPKGELGKLKITFAKFFRVNGSSTQFKGVVPDISFPMAESVVDYGERSLDNALPWTAIDEVEHELFPSKIDSELINTLYQRHKSRVKDNVGFDYLMSEFDFVNELDQRKEVSLLLEERNKMTDELLIKRLEKYNDFQKYLDKETLTKDEFLAQLTDDELPLDEDEEELSDDLKNIQPHKDLKEDVLLDETSKVLNDFINLTS